MKQHVETFGGSRRPHRAVRFVALLLPVVAACYSGSAERLADESSPLESPAPAAAVVGADLRVDAEPLPEPTAAAGRVRALADLGARAIAFGDQGVAAVAGDAVVVRAARGGGGWTGAAAVAAADGSGTWGVAASADGALVRLRDGGELEDVGARYGLARADHAHAVTPMGDHAFVVALDAGFTVVDVRNARTTRFDVGPVTQLAASKNGRVATLAADGVFVVDIATGARSELAVTGARAAAFDAGDRLVVATEHAVLRESGVGLERIVSRDDVAIHSLVVAGGRVWFTAGAELWALEDRTLRRAPNVNVPDGAALAPSPSGDVWLVGDALIRCRPQVAPDEAAWVASVLPVFEHVCSSCHNPGGDSGIDLSTYGAWAERRARIADRVLAQANMPPPPDSLRADEKSALATWLRAPQRP